MSNWLGLREDQAQARNLVLRIASLFPAPPPTAVIQRSADGRSIRRWAGSPTSKAVD
jgi:hypothetical protein